MKKFIAFFTAVAAALSGLANNPFESGHYVAPATYWATYYINPAGNDATGTGSIGSPWQSLYKATSTVTSAGNLIYVQAGTYTETTQCILAPGVSITGDGSTSIIKSTLTADFSEIINVRSATEGTDGKQSISYVKLDGDNLTTSWGICVAARSNVSIHHCEFINFRETAVNYSGIAAPTAPNAPTTYATGNTFYNNTITNCSNKKAYFGFTYGTGCFQFGGQVGMLIHDNNIQQPQRTSGTNDDIGWPIKKANEGHIRGCKVYNNILKRAVIAATNGDNQNWNFAFEMWYVEGGFEMYNNELQGEVDLAEVDKGTYAFGAKLYNNKSSTPTIVSHQAYAYRLEVDISDVELYGDTVFNMSGAITFNPKDYNSDGTGIDVHRVNVHNNLFYNMGITGGGTTAVWPDNRTSSPGTRFTDFSFDNNTLIGAGSGNANHFGLEIPSYDGGNTKRIYVRNNHIQGFSVNSVIIGNGSMLDSLFFQNNNRYGNTDNNTLIFSGASPTNYTNTGNTTNSPNLDGLYRPNVGSPLIDAGVATGASFNGAALDQGYYETDGNVLPVADAGADQVITLPTSSVTLTGTGTDADGTITAYLWTKISGPSGGTIVSSTTASTLVSGLTAGVFVFQLQVTDNSGGTHTDQVQVTVNAAPPVVENSFIIRGIKRN